MANQDQIDELVSLQSIYDGDADVLIELPEHLLQTPADSTRNLEQPDLKFEVDVVIRMSEAVTLQSIALDTHLQMLRGQQYACTAPDNNLTVQALPLKLEISVPASYLHAECVESVMPCVAISATWLPSNTRENLERELERQGHDHRGSQILFLWIEWLRNEACTFLQETRTSEIHACDVVGTEGQCKSLVVSGDLSGLIDWDQKREGHLLQKSIQQLCGNCGELLPGSSCRLGICKHVLCVQCIAVMTSISRNNKVTPCCPLPQCHEQMTSDMIGDLEVQRPQPETNDLKRILGTPIKDVVVFCPRCEDLGVDTPVSTSNVGKHVSEACVCPKCVWVFCSVCRSPWHGSEACTADPYRAARMLRRRPPLPSDMLEAVHPKVHTTEAPTKPMSEKELADAATVAKSTIKSKRNEQNFWTNAIDGIEHFSTESPYDALRWHILGEHGQQIYKSLTDVFGFSVRLRPVPMDKAVSRAFMHRASNCSDIRPAFHGTDVKNYSSIFHRGLLIPGDGNTLRVVHGTAHGRGVYTANVDAAWLSKGFCSDTSMLVCAVLVSSAVRFAGDAMVVQLASDVIPIFEARANRPSPTSCSMPASTTKSALPSPAVKTPCEQKKAKHNKPSANSFVAKLTKKSQKHR